MTLWLLQLCKSMWIIQKPYPQKTPFYRSGKYCEFMLSTHLDKWKIITGYMEKYLCGKQWKVQPVYVILARETFIAEIFAGFPEKKKKGGHSDVGLRKRFLPDISSGLLRSAV